MRPLYIVRKMPNLSQYLTGYFFFSARRFFVMRTKGALKKKINDRFRIFYNVHPLRGRTQNDISRVFSPAFGYDGDAPVEISSRRNIQAPFRRKLSRPIGIK